MENLDLQNISNYINIFIGLLAIVDPIGAMPIFLSITQPNTIKEKKAIARLTALSFFVILLVGMILGESILAAFSISIAAFRVAGGYVLFTMGISMLNSDHSEVRSISEEDKIISQNPSSIAVVPLAIPLLAGPGSLSAVIVYAHQEGNVLYNDIALGISITFIALLILITFSLAPEIDKWIGKTGMNIIAKIMGLITMSMAVEFIAGGMRDLFPGLQM